MARTRRRRTGGINRAVKRTVRRVKTTATRRAPAGGGDLLKAVHGLIRALPVAELERRLAGLEKTVERLESSVRGAVRRATSAQLCEQRDVQSAVRRLWITAAERRTDAYSAAWHGAHQGLDADRAEHRSAAAG